MAAVQEVIERLARGDVDEIFFDIEKRIERTLKDLPQLRNTRSLVDVFMESLRTSDVGSGDTEETLYEHLLSRRRYEIVDRLMRGLGDAG